MNQPLPIERMAARLIELVLGDAEIREAFHELMDAHNSTEKASEARFARERTTGEWTLAESVRAVDHAQQAIAEAHNLLGAFEQECVPQELRVDLLMVAAHVQSAARSALAQHGHADREAIDLFKSVAALASEYQIYLRRHMKRGDQADPSDLPDLLDKLCGLRQQMYRIGVRFTREAGER